MSWPATLGVALSTAVAGMFAAGYTANLAASWYRISGFEGQAGYFVVLLALVGLVAGALLGLIVARAFAAGFLQATAVSLGLVVALTVLVALPARLLADVPPKIDGDPLLLAVEYRWPVAQVDPPALPAGSESPAHVRFGSVAGTVERRGEVGPFWLEDSRREDGRWITPGAVEVFTERGKRLVAFFLGDSVLVGAFVPLPRRPGRKYLDWSEWLPLTSDPNGPSYRFRVHRWSQPIRTETHGPFEIGMSTASFWMDRDRQGRQRITTSPTFAITHDGEPVVVEHPGPYGSIGDDRIARADAVAVIDGPRPALLACMDRYDRPCFLLVSEDGALRTQFIGGLARGSAGFELTSDPARWDASRTREWRRGSVERLFEYPRVYLIDGAVLDTRTLSWHDLPERDDVTVPSWATPVAISPDGRSFARAAMLDAGGDVLLVTDLDGGDTYTLPIDRRRMRFTRAEDIDFAWVMHHFEWVPDDAGGHRLAERGDFRPLPYRGRVSDEPSGYRGYHLDGATQPLVDSLLEFLYTELGADRNTERSEYGFRYRVRVGGRPIHVGYFDSDGGYVYASTDPTEPHPEVITTIAERFDAALATGRYDHLFAR